jgi:precorrin-8X/cobalt-precorrin-8 methylmutase
VKWRGSPLFDAYLVVDWSAANAPRQGADSIWLCHLRRENGRLRQTTLENPATRQSARERLLQLLEADRAAGRRTLAGFDFPLGYPAGLAARLGLAEPGWHAVWEWLAARLVDGPDNRNNRFEVAACMNERVSGEAAPLWGCPSGAARPFLAPTHHRRFAALGLAEQRLTDRRVKGPQPVWKLYGNGSVGSQALTGIPVLYALRRALAPTVAVWPLETGLMPPRLRPGEIVFAEVYPSLLPAQPLDGEVKDSAQVRALARHFAALDAAGSLAPLFHGDPSLDDAERAQVEREESWILGVTGAPQRYRYLRDPEAIYRRSFALIRRETDLDRVPCDLRPLALRLVHAAGEPSLVHDLRWSEDAAASGRAALRAGAPVLVDAKMVAAGVIPRLLPKQNRVLCTLDDKRVPALARRLGTTRSAAAIELWRPYLDGAVVAIGNAPTALFHLLEMIAHGAPRPALILGFPVGFVGAAEAKAALAENRLDLPFVALAGRRGGSALAAAALNALAAGAKS